MSSIIIAVEVNRGQNIGTIVRCAVAFGLKAIIVVGSNKYGTHGK